MEKERQVVLLRWIIVSITLLSLTIAHADAQQRQLYSQYMFNGLAINPAYSGVQKQLSVMGIYRQQWVNIDRAPSVTAVSMHSAFREKPVGVGLMIHNEQVGVHNDLGMYGSYAYQIRFREGTLSMGLQAGFNNLKSDFGRLDLVDANDPNVGSFSKFNPNFGTGLFYSKKDSYLGFSIPYLLNNRTLNNDNDAVLSQAREARYYFLTAGKVFDVDPNFKVMPSVLIRIHEGSPVGYDVNTNFILKDLINLGVSYRSNDAIVMLFMVQPNENFGFGYAYDYTLSDLTRYTTGSHEFMLNYRLSLGRDKCHTYF